MGLLLLAEAGGSYRLSELLSNGEAIRGHAWRGWIVVLILVGAMTKSAQFPFHFWLPSAMEAPTPVSAYLHSATMVKAGVYLVARMSPVLRRCGWEFTLVATGALTAILGGFLSWQQTDLKRIFGHSTIGGLGIMMLLFGLGTPSAAKAGIVCFWLIRVTRAHCSCWPES